MTSPHPPLHATHVALGASMVDFAGWDMLHPTAAAQPSMLANVWGKRGPMLKK